MRAKAAFFDVANTLLQKPDLYPTLLRVLSDHGITVPYPKLLASHRFLSEVILFPDRTSREFYQDFNSHLLRSFGVVPTDALLEAMFLACSYLPWAAFADVEHLTSIKTPLGVLSNWDTSLREKLSAHTPLHFEWILGSAEQNVRKPAAAFFTKILSATGLEAHEIIYVGDSVRLDIEPALRLGIQAVLIDRDNLYPSATVPRITNLGELRRTL